MPKNCPLNKKDSHACWECLFSFGNSCIYYEMKDEAEEAAKLKTKKSTCEYCDMTSVNKEHACKDYFIHKSFSLIDAHTKKHIEADGTHPEMYLREYRNEGLHLWSLIVEFADEAGTVVELPISYCPICGNKLIGKNNG